MGENKTGSHHPESGKKCTVNNVQLYCELSGHSGEPLILVHGSWVDHHNWNRVVPGLSQSFRTLTYDRRGHSRSERSASQGSIHQDVADLAALIEEWQLGPAHVVGSSAGGSIALRLAGERPDLFRSLIVHEPPLFSLLADGEHEAMLKAARERIEAVAGLLEAGDAEGGARRFVETIVYGPGAWEQVPSELKKTVIFNSPTFLDEVRDDDFFGIDLTRLIQFPHPVLLSYGGKTAPIFPPIIGKLAAALSHAEQITFQEAGHEPEQTHPETYVASLLAFIRRAG
ncbi:MAG TPA: alpha/beta hydrolase [Chryseolinea sp.]|nr:alpha/beta hydrolase [Chryseolinea sp.]